jgi:hypothetical protein
MTTLDAPSLLSRLHEIEADAGRVRRERWGARTIDLDLLMFGSERVSTSRLTLPHPRMAVRRFVLAPLAEVAPAAVHPSTGRTIVDLLANLDRRPSVLSVAAPEIVRDDLIGRLRDALPSGSLGWRIVAYGRESVIPTFVAATTGTALAARSKAVDRPPSGEVVLAPEAMSLDEIVSEILADCQASRVG